jgi:uncharacterized Zn-binding protein involved in type VI secretion
MQQAAAKSGDWIVAQADIHMVQPSGPSNPYAAPLPFAGRLDGGLSADVFFDGEPAATQGSRATNQAKHMAPPGCSFVRQPDNKGQVMGGSASVYVNNKPVARHDDQAQTCADPVPNGAAKVQAVGTVFAG